MLDLDYLAQLWIAEESPYDGELDDVARGPAERVGTGSLGASGEVYRLLTTILDPADAPATDLAALYQQRWEIESAFDEIKTHEGGRSLVLRSQHPEGVEQEIYAFILVRHSLRELMCRAAHDGGHDPDRLSFIRTLRIARRHVTEQAALSPSRLARALTRARGEIRERLLPPRGHAPTPASSNARCPTGH